jgi:hypothetical protein
LRALINFSAPTPIADLWKIARAFLADALNAFGGPQTIQRTLDRIAHRAIKRQLKALEMVALKLLLIEAVNRTPLAATPRRAKPIGQGRVAPAADPARPETWRVCFQLHIPPEPEEHSGPRIRSLGPSPFVRATVVDAKTMAKKLAFMAAARVKRSDEARARSRAERLARRFEALRRVFANPAPSARRLKRKLLALKREAFAAARRIAALKPPQRQLDPLFAERAQYAAQRATPAFDSS